MPPSPLPPRMHLQPHQALSPGLFQLTSLLTAFASHLVCHRLSLPHENVTCVRAGTVPCSLLPTLRLEVRLGLRRGRGVDVHHGPAIQAFFFPGYILFFLILFFFHYHSVPSYIPPPPTIATCYPCP